MVSGGLGSQLTNVIPYIQGDCKSQCLRLFTNSGSDEYNTDFSLCSPQLLNQEGSELASADKEQGELEKGP